MKTLAYIGLKIDGERAFQERTGIEWMPGSEHEVKDEDAEVMLKHTDVWKEVPPTAKATAKLEDKVPAAPVAPAGGSQLPEWVKKGIELGATDEQLEAIAQAGGPESEAGAPLWKDATGTDWTPTAPTKTEEKAKPAAKKAAAKKAPAKKVSRRPKKAAE
jgi:hypothetical protein